jgi:hypothetical protein
MLASRSRSLVQAVSFWPRIGKTQVQIRASLCEVNGAQKSTETGFSLSTTGFRPVTIIPPLLHVHLRLHVALTEGQAGEAWEPSKKQRCYGNWRELPRKILSNYFLAS